MGGKSSSSQSTANNQSTTNLVNDGEYAGASDIFIDESDRSVKDSNNTEFNLDQEIDNSVEIDQDIDNSSNQEYDYSGDNAGNSGTITITDGGAIKAAEEISKAAIEAANKQSEVNQKIVSDSLDKSFGFGEKALDTVNSSTSKALDSVSTTAQKALTEVSEFGTDAIDTVSTNLTAQSDKFVSSLTGLSSANSQLSQKVLADAAEANTEDKEIIAELAKSTSLAGQDLVAKSSEKMVLYIAIAIGVVGVSLAVASGVRK
ncbi:hypothetical protein [Neptunicella sp. SCSIO 80796]|uniref:hypothetical protein n=1 Tax=Neptunicella plasticusilytica TaxID=3117012 RepID=UPI003A4E4BDB